MPNPAFGSKEYRTFWEVYSIIPEHRSYVTPILRAVCLDCFDLAWQGARRPGFTYDNVNEKISELCARALRGGKRAPSFDMAPHSLERASVLAEWDQDEPQRRLNKVNEVIFSGDHWNRVWSYHLDGQSNRHLSMSDETPDFVYRYRAVYRHARKAAGVKGEICRYDLSDECRHPLSRSHPLARQYETHVVFEREAFIAKRVHAEVYSQIKSLERHGWFVEGRGTWGNNWKWESMLASQILFESAPKLRARGLPPMTYKGRTPAPREDLSLFFAADGLHIGMLNPTVVPLAARLAYFKEQRLARNLERSRNKEKVA